MTGKERVSRILKRQTVDRIAAFETFWPDTEAKWRMEGHLAAGQKPEDPFNFDITGTWCLNATADIDFKDQVVEETEETKLVRDGNGALLRWHKKHSSTPEHVDYLVKEHAAWEEHIRPKILDEKQYERRVNVAWWNYAKEKSRKNGQFLLWESAHVFEYMVAVCGHENLLVAMALDPKWVMDMCDVYSTLIMNMLEVHISKHGTPDGIWFFEDLGFKHKPFMSPAMYNEIIQPYHKKTFDFCHSHGLPVMVHSCGFMEPLLPGLVEAGIDCLQAMEVKAGMDIFRIKKQFGERITLMGGIDVRPLVANDKKAIEAELSLKIPVVKKSGGYILHTDHSIPDQVEFDTYKYFLELGLSLGRY